MDVRTQTVLDLTLARAHVVRILDSDLGFLHGISLSDFAVLAELDAAPDGRMRRGDLASRLGVTPSAITRQLGPLERIGLVGREPHARDARLALATLTDAGRRILSEAEPTAAEASERALSLWAAEEQELLWALLARARTSGRQP
jgi:DNA-binding MarR family transcriptional regulator